MAPPTEAVRKLVIAGQQAGLTPEEMIHLLHNGVSMETLLQLITIGIQHPATAVQ